MKKKVLIKLFLTFFKIGMISFGGGYAVIPLLQREVVEKRKWITNEELADFMAISQTLPGIIMVNSSTMIGCKIGGGVGAAIATLSAILPSFVITIIITMFFWNFTDIPIVRKAFTGILLGVTSLIIYSLTKTWKSVIKDKFDILLAVLSAAFLIVFKTSAVIVILVAMFIGFIHQLIILKKVG